LAGAVHEIVAEALPGTALTPLGAAGGPAGVTGAEAGDGAPVPLAFEALTVKVYVVPLVRPFTTADVAGGDPVTVVAGWGVVPMNGVTV
jgi:hypothetical protein